MSTSARLCVALVVLAWLGCCGPAAATAGDAFGGAGLVQERDWTACAAAIRQVESRSSLPRGLLNAVALTESGRWRQDQRVVTPWPWTVNSEGEGHYFDSAGAAMAFVTGLQRRGVRSMDVGCMQINLLHHPEAFASLQDAFDPLSNVAYGARFLTDLRVGTNSLDRAVERYHSADPERGQDYRLRVYARWKGDAPAPSTGWGTASAGWVTRAPPGEGAGRPLPLASRLSLLAARGVAIPHGLWGPSGAGGRVAVLLPRSPLGGSAGGLDRPAASPAADGGDDAALSSGRQGPQGRRAGTPGWPAPAGGPGPGSGIAPGSARGPRSPAWSATPSLPFRSIVHPGNARLPAQAAARAAPPTMPAPSAAPRFLPILRSGGPAFRSLAGSARPATGRVASAAVPRPYREPLRAGPGFGTAIHPLMATAEPGAGRSAASAPGGSVAEGRAPGPSAAAIQGTRQTLPARSVPWRR